MADRQFIGDTHSAVHLHRFPRDGAILRPNIDPREWRANVTQIRNAQGTAMNGVDARELVDHLVMVFLAGTTEPIPTRAGPGATP